MQHFYTVFRALPLGCLLLLFGFSSAPPTSSADTAVLLPLEVIGADGYTRSVAFTLDQATGIDALYVKAHRLAYRDASTNPDRKAKGSVRLNGGAWIDLDNSTVDCYAHEAEFGCLSGAYHTVRLTVPIRGAVAGKNTLQFRFNGTDGFSSGYRILEFNLRQGSRGADRLPKSTFVQDNPANWKAPLTGAADIAAGKQHWETATLDDAPGGGTIKASCANCHAQDGRDLEYYSFSNRSIEERSKYHGLSSKQGKQIASYIRSLNKTAGVQRLGRPWNPPYQPGPDLDAKPVEAWAAGAGLEWVLEDDAAAVLHAFAGSISARSVADVLDIDKTHNTRETPIALQLPDWQEWLPEVHPMDAPRIGQKFYTAPLIRNTSLNAEYEKTLELLESGSVAALTANGRLKTQLKRLAEQTTNLNSRMRGALGFSLSTREGVTSYIMKWGAVKSWEIMHAYELEELAPTMFGEYGEARSWVSSRRNVFELAPHRVANDKSSMQHQTKAVGKYFSTAWYQLQLVINAGNRETLRLWPVDWNYQPNHINDLYTQARGPKHPYRYVLSHAKMLQQYNDDKPVAKSGIGFRQIHPGRYAPEVGPAKSLFTGLDPAVRATLYAGLLNATMDLIERHEVGEWPRDTVNYSVRDNTLRPPTYRPRVIENFPKELHSQRHADCWYTMIPHFRGAGVDEATLDRLIDWGEIMWPRGNWEALRVKHAEPQTKPQPTELADGVYQLLARHSGKALAVDVNWRTNGGHTDPTRHGVNIFQYGEDQWYNRQWRVEAVAGQEGYYKLTSIYSHRALCIDLNAKTNRTGDSRANGTNIFQWGNDDRDNRLWKIEPVGDGYYKLTSKHSGKVLDVSGRSGEDGTNVHQWDYRGGANQQWSFVPVPPPTKTLTFEQDSKSKAEHPVLQPTISVYPNPVTDRLTIEGAQPGQHITLHDAMGRVVVRQHAVGGALRLDVSQLPAGAYLLWLYDEDQEIANHRVIVE